LGRGKLNAIELTIGRRGHLGPRAQVEHLVHMQREHRHSDADDEECDEYHRHDRQQRTNEPPSPTVELPFWEVPSMGDGVSFSSRKRSDSCERRPAPMYEAPPRAIGRGIADGVIAPAHKSPSLPVGKAEVFSEACGRYSDPANEMHQPEPSAPDPGSPPEAEPYVAPVPSRAGRWPRPARPRLRDAMGVVPSALAHAGIVAFVMLSYLPPPLGEPSLIEIPVEVVVESS
jgi:hypothetical protein